MENPGKSGQNGPRNVYGDRFVPMRIGNNWNLQTPFPPQSLEPFSHPGSEDSLKLQGIVTASQKPVNPYNQLLYKEVLGSQNSGGGPETLFHYSRRKASANDTIRTLEETNMLTPFNRRILLAYAIRKNLEIPTTERLVLTAPGMADNFYYHLLDWSANNLVGIGLRNTVFMQKAFTDEQTTACTLVGPHEQIVTAVKWNEKGDLVALGTNRRTVQIYDMNHKAPLKIVYALEGKIMALAWHGNCLLSGSRNGMIFQTDVRCSNGYRPDRILKDDTRQICSLKISPDGEHFASSGRDGRISIWTMRSDKPVRIISGHKASIKALDWSPHEYGILASGGGSGDPSIRFWNVLTGIDRHRTMTKSQICNLAWSPKESKLVTTHGYGSNAIKVWDYPSMKLLVNLEKHNCRVQYMAMSPKGDGIVTGGADETIRFWKIFGDQVNIPSEPTQLSRFNRIR